MITRDHIEHEIHNLMECPISWGNLEKLDLLMRIQKHLWRMDKNPELTPEEASEWVQGMANWDGSHGGHWSREQTRSVMAQRGIHHPECAWYAAMNAMWSDFGKVAQKYNVDKVEFWADLTNAWLSDEDAKPGKAARYYHRIVT